MSVNIKKISGGSQISRINKLAGASKIQSIIPIASAGGGGGGSPPASDLAENFIGYTSTANMLSDPRGIYSTGEDVNTAMMAYDTTVGYPSYGLNSSMRYDWPDRTSEGNPGYCGDDTIGRNINLPSHQTNIWVELVHKTQSTFTTLVPGCGGVSAAAYKTLFGRTDVSRYNIVMGIFGENSDYTWGYPGNEEPADFAMTWTPFDGNWHVYRMRMTIGNGTGAAILMVDGTIVKSFTNVTTSASYIYGIALGRNMNQGPLHTQSEWWGALNVWWTFNPGWGF